MKCKMKYKGQKKDQPTTRDILWGEVMAAIRAGQPEIEEYVRHYGIMRGIDKAKLPVRRQMFESYMKHFGDRELPAYENSSFWARKSIIELGVVDPMQLYDDAMKNQDFKSAFYVTYNFGLDEKLRDQAIQKRTEQLVANYPNVEDRDLAICIIKMIHFGPGLDSDAGRKLAIYTIKAWADPKSEVVAYQCQGVGPKEVAESAKQTRTFIEPSKN